MYCGQCGKKVMDNMLFCPFCGSPIVIPEQDEPQQPAAAAVPVKKAELLSIRIFPRIPFSTKRATCLKVWK